MLFHVSAARPQLCAMSHAGLLTLSFTSPVHRDRPHQGVRSAAHRQRDRRDGRRSTSDRGGARGEGTMRRCTECAVDIEGTWTRCPLCTAPVAGEATASPLPAVPLRFSRRRVLRVLFLSLDRGDPGVLRRPAAVQPRTRRHRGPSLRVAGGDHHVAGGVDGGAQTPQRRQGHRVPRRPGRPGLRVLGLPHRLAWLVADLRGADRQRLFHRRPADHGPGDADRGGGAHPLQRFDGSAGPGTHRVPRVSAG